MSRHNYNNRSSSSSSSSHSPQLFSQSQIEELSNDSRNEVYVYTNDDPTKIYTVEQQKRLIGQIRSAFLTMKSLQQNEQNNEISPSANTSLLDCKIRQEMKKNNPEWALFAENNTRIFELCTNSKTTNDEMNHILYMLYLREQMENGVLTTHQAQEKIQDYLVSRLRTNMTLEEYKEQMKKEKEAQEAKRKKQRKTQREQPLAPSPSAPSTLSPLVPSPQLPAVNSKLNTDSTLSITTPTPTPTSISTITPPTTTTT